MGRVERISVIEMFPGTDQLPSHGGDGGGDSVEPHTIGDVFIRILEVIFTHATPDNLMWIVIALLVVRVVLRRQLRKKDVRQW